MHEKKYLLVIQKTLRLFVNTLTLDDKHYVLNRDNLTQPIQIQLSQKQKTFSEFFFSSFSESMLNFKHLPKLRKMVRWSKKPIFRGPLEEEVGKWVETLLQSEWLYFGNIY